MEELRDVVCPRMRDRLEEIRCEDERRYEKMTRERSSDKTTVGRNELLAKLDPAPGRYRKVL